MRNIIICKQCGKPFKAKRKDAKTCSTNCRVAAFKERELNKRFTRLGLSPHARQWFDWLAVNDNEVYQLLEDMLKRRGAEIATEGIYIAACHYVEKNDEQLPQQQELL